MTGLYHYNPNSNETVAYSLEDFQQLFKVKSSVLDTFGLCKPVSIEYQINPESPSLRVNQSDGSIVYEVSQQVDKEFELKLVLSSPDPYGIFEGSIKYTMTVAIIPP